MKKKSLNSKKLALKKSVIASMDKNTVKGGTRTATFETLCGPACGETVFFTQCNGANQCGLFDTQFLCNGH